MDEPPRGAKFAREQSVCSPPLQKRTVAPAVDFCQLYNPLEIVITCKNRLNFSGPSAADRVDSRPFDRASTVFLKRLRFPSRRTAKADLARPAGSRHVPEGSDWWGKCPNSSLSCLFFSNLLPTSRSGAQQKHHRKVQHSRLKALHLSAHRKHGSTTAPWLAISGTICRVPEKYAPIRNSGSP
jgi:hypothetical protein